MKKRIIKVLTLILMFYIPNVYAGEFYLCSYVGPLKAFKIAGTVIYVSKIIAPLIIIIMASIGFGKALISGDEKDLKEEASKLIKRFIAGIVIFFIPTIIGLVLGFVSNYNETVSNYVDCNTCLFHPFSETCTGKISLSSEYTSDKKVDVTINPYHTTGGLSGDDDDNSDDEEHVISWAVCNGDEFQYDTSEISSHVFTVQDGISCPIKYAGSAITYLEMNPSIENSLINALKDTCSFLNAYTYKTIDNNIKDKELKNFEYYQLGEAYVMEAGCWNNAVGKDEPHYYGLAIDIFNNWKYIVTDKNGVETQYMPYSLYGSSDWSEYKKFICDVCDGDVTCPQNLNYQIYNYAFKKYGFCWGGNYSINDFDPMHFRYSPCNDTTICYYVEKDFTCN